MRGSTLKGVAEDERALVTIPQLKEFSFLNGFLGQSLNDRTILFLVILLDKTVSVG